MNESPKKVPGSVGSFLKVGESDTFFQISPIFKQSEYRTLNSASIINYDWFDAANMLKTVKNYPILIDVLPMDTVTDYYRTFGEFFSQKVTFSDQSIRISNTSSDKRTSTIPDGTIQLNKKVNSFIETHNRETAQVVNGR